jgi:hypothetical protein
MIITLVNILHLSCKSDTRPCSNFFLYNISAEIRGAAASALKHWLIACCNQNNILLTPIYESGYSHEWFKEEHIKRLLLAYQEWSLGHLYNKSLLMFWTSPVQLQQTLHFPKSIMIHLGCQPISQWIFRNKSYRHNHEMTKSIR